MHSSYRIQPNDQTSVAILWDFFKITSGELYASVPIPFVNALHYITDKAFASPKSLILTIPYFVNKMF